MNVTAEDLKLAIGENVRNRRLECGLSQQALAQSINCTQSQIAQIETGKTSPSIELVVKLAIKLKTEPHVLFAPNSFAAVSA
jgi:transcriptional regulator with XRE-family HTH domain